MKHTVLFATVLLGTDHPGTATIRNKLGTVRGEHGDYLQAPQYVHQALTIRKRVLGPDHPATATRRNNLGRVLERQEHYGEAQRSYEQGLVIYQEVLGKDHPNTHIVHRHLEKRMNTHYEP